MWSGTCSAITMHGVCFGFLEFCGGRWGAKLIPSPPATESFCVTSNLSAFFPSPFVLLLFLFFFSTTVLVPASCGAAFAPVPSSPRSDRWPHEALLSHGWLHPRRCVHTRPFLSSFLWGGPLLSTRCRLMGSCPLLSSKPSAVVLVLLLSSFLIMSCSLILLFGETFDLHWLTWKRCCHVSFTGFILFCICLNPFNLFSNPTHSPSLSVCSLFPSSFECSSSFFPAPHSTFVSPKMSFWQKHNRIFTWIQLWCCKET